MILKLTEQLLPGMAFQAVPFCLHNFTHRVILYSIGLKQRLMEGIALMYTYAWYHWLTFFYLYCFFGWIFESAYVSLKKQHFVNRGFLRLPMLPLYGTGAIMMLWVSLPVQDNPVLVYCSGVIAATLLEYVTGYGMELLFKVRYWDYSNQPFNVKGYICLSSSVAWGFLTLFMTDIIHRPIESMVLHLPLAVEGIFLILVSALFLYDTVQSTREALDLARALETITRLRTELEELQVQLALLKAETTQNVQTLKDSVMDSMSESVAAHKDSFEAAFDARRDSFSASLGAHKDSIEARIASMSGVLTETSERLKQHLAAFHPSILRRNPGAASNRFASALKELRTTWEARRNE